MGTTANRALRYPEGNVSSNVLHTQIKNLADDVDAQLTGIKAGVLGRSIGQAVTNGTTYPTSGVEFNIVSWNSGTIPTGTEISDISVSMNASASANAAAYWGLDVLKSNGTWLRIAAHRAHNNGTNTTNVGFNVNASVAMAELGSVTALTVRVTINVDAGGTAISTGPLNITVTHKNVN